MLLNPLQQKALLLQHPQNVANRNDYLTVVGFDSIRWNEWEREKRKWETVYEYENARGQRRQFHVQFAVSIEASYFRLSALSLSFGRSHWKSEPISTQTQHQHTRPGRPKRRPFHINALGELKREKKMRMHATRRTRRTRATRKPTSHRQRALAWRLCTVCAEVMIPHSARSVAFRQSTKEQKPNNV